jgi:hypothetical protein
MGHANKYLKKKKKNVCMYVCMYVKGKEAKTQT